MFTNIIILIANFALCLGNAAGGRIVNGTDANPGEIPYIVSLRLANTHICGGSILTSNHVLTAAHCIVNKSANMFSVQYGKVHIEYSPNASNVIAVSTIVSHPGFINSRDKGYINDIGLIKLAAEINFSIIVRPIILPPSFNNTPENQKATLSGWGALYTGNFGTTDLQKVEIKVFSDIECETAFTDYGETNRSAHVCAGIDGGGKGQCNGDSGGPLVVDGIQVGIVSWSVKPCTRPDYPGVFTKVSTQIDWIKEQISNL